jgi:hypothetical protein
LKRPNFEIVLVITAQYMGHNPADNLFDEKGNLITNATNSMKQAAANAKKKLKRAKKSKTKNKNSKRKNSSAKLQECQLCSRKVKKPYLLCYMHRFRNENYDSSDIVIEKSFTKR